MQKIQLVKTVNVEREKAFKAGTDFESFTSKLPQYFKLIRIRSVREFTSVVEIHGKIAGKEFAVMTKNVIKQPEIHETFVLSGDARGSHFIKKYESVPGGTRITIDIDLKLRGLLRFASVFSVNKIQKIINEYFDDFTKAIET
ncbi:MAG TPA: polyketide cyclase [Nitrosopumilaceae archaeon]|nr:polyketide cyclase [Nitrosopumilaceae archaeon]